MVANCTKQRFSLKPNPATNPALSTTTADPSHYLIRANQGHSIKLESSSVLQPLASPEDYPPRVLHGTYLAFWPAIVAAGGLRRMGRTHVHCSTGTPEEGVLSGMRKDAEVLVEIDVERSVREGGLKWWRSENGVLLTEGDGDGVVSSRFFKLVTGRTQDVGVLWQDGEWVADLPEGIKVNHPQGKQGRSGRRGGRGQGGKRGS